MKEVLNQNVRAIQQLLQVNIGREQLHNLFISKHVHLVLTDDISAHQVALRTAANLLARLSFVVSIDGESVGVAQTLNESELLNLGIKQDRGERAELKIGIGSNGALVDCSAYASGWNIHFIEGRKSYEKLRTSNELCGAMLGVLIASEAFNHLIGPTLGKKQFQSEISLSLLTYTDTLSTENAGLPSVDLPWAALIGCGAVGNAMIYALASLPSVSGQLEIIDPDWFTKTNSHRYMLSALDEQEVPHVFKTSRARDFLAHHKELKVTGYEKTFQRYLEEDRPDRNIPLIISAVDNFVKRRDLGRETPREAINASTGQFSLLVSTHYAAYKKDCQPCLGCHYPHQNAEHERNELIARETGLSIQQVEDFSRSNEPMKKEVLEQIALHRKTAPEDFAEFEGQPFDSLYQHGICGGSKIETSDGAAEIPLAQVSAAAGVLLAVELVKRFLPSLHNYRIQNFLQLDMLNLSSNWFMQNKPARADCDCGLLTFQKRYSQKYDEL